MKHKTLSAINNAAQLMAALDAAGWGLIVLRADSDADIRRVVALYPHKRCETEYRTKDMHYYRGDQTSGNMWDNIKEAIGGGVTKNFFSPLTYPGAASVDKLRVWLEQCLITGSRYRMMFIPDSEIIIGKANGGRSDSRHRTQEQTQYVYLIRALCEEKRKGGNHSLIVIGSRTGELCEELSEYAYVIDIGCPDEKELAEIIWQSCSENGGEHHGLEVANANELAAISRGMREDDIRAIINLAFARNEFPLANNAEILFNVALDAKKQRISGVRGLRWIDNNAATQIGGMEDARRWLKMRSDSFIYTYAAQKCKAAPPKGVLLAGLPGCGKTLFAKYASILLSNGKVNRTPVLQMDLSAMLGGYVGDSETNFACALRMIENVAPCIVIVDEIEKFFGGVSQGGHETSRHIFASLLEWMQAEHSKPILVIATANNVTSLPPELKRKGRFDETFFVSIPTQADCEDIIRIHLKSKKAVLEPSFDYNRVARSFLIAATAKLRFFNGADIEAVINSAFCSLFADMDDVTKANIQQDGEIPKSFYSTPKVEEALLKELDRTRSYFDNNMDETASYWILMRRLNFRNAGGADLFEGIPYDEDKGMFSFECVPKQDDGKQDDQKQGGRSEYLDALKKELERIETSAGEQKAQLEEQNRQQLALMINRAGGAGTGPNAPATIEYDAAFRYKLAISIFKQVHASAGKE